jgi:hypothetical protein
MASRRVTADPDEVTEEGEEQRSVLIRRAVELLR